MNAHRRITLHLHSKTIGGRGPIGGTLQAMRAGGSNRSWGQVCRRGQVGCDVIKGGVAAVKMINLLYNDTLLSLLQIIEILCIDISSTLRL